MDGVKMGEVPANLLLPAGRHRVEVVGEDKNGSDEIVIQDGASDALTIDIYDRHALLPDTGQTTSYTDTFGEDHDYTINAPSYTDNGDETITDNNTRLIWQKEDDNNGYTWSKAETYCENLSLASQTDWRLPNRRELMSIADYEIYKPAINEIYFPNTNSSVYWSSTTYASDTSNTWDVDFGNGCVYSIPKSNNYYVRCVRGGQ